MVGWPHQLNGHEFEQAPGDNKGQGGLGYCSPWGHRVRHNLVTKQQQLTLEKIQKSKNPNSNVEQMLKNILWTQESLFQKSTVSDV